MKAADQKSQVASTLDHAAMLDPAERLASEEHLAAALKDYLSKHGGHVGHALWQVAHAIRHRNARPPKRTSDAPTSSQH